MQTFEVTLEQEEQLLLEECGNQDLPPLCLNDYTVSVPFREYLKETMPGLADRPEYWRMVGYLMFGTWRNGKRGERQMPVVGSRLLAEIAGKNHRWQWRNFSARDFLEEFRDEVLPISWSGWDYEAQKCRVLTRLEWPAGVEDALHQEMNSATEDGRQVYLAQGKLVSRATQRTHHRATQKKALALATRAACEPARNLLLYLNGRSPRRFSEVRRRLPKAQEEARRTLDLNGREQQQRVLRNVAECPQPFLKPTRGSVRIFPMTENLLGLRKDLRLMLTEGWLEADIQCAQLAICAHDWCVPEVKTFLRDVKMDPWPYFAMAAGVELNRRTKAALKKAVYSLCFGMRGWKIEKELSEKLGVAGAASFIRDHIIGVLLEARSRRLDEIQHDKGAMNCFGQRLVWAQEIKRGINPTGTYNRRSILAQMAQAMELRLLEPVVDLALGEAGSSHGFSVLLWMHDGFTFVPHHKRDDQCWRNRLEEAVANQAARMGVFTTLKVGLS